MKTIFAVLPVIAVAKAAFAISLSATGFEAVPTNTHVITYIQLWPPNAEFPTNAVAQIRTLDGTGAAVFIPGNVTTINLTSSTNLHIIGTSISSAASNMIFEVIVGEGIHSAHIFTVVSDAVIPAEDAIAIARNATTIHIPEDAPISVSLSGGQYTITFATTPEPGLRQADYHVQVILDAQTGSVLYVFMGS